MQAIDARIRGWLVWLAPFVAVALLLGWETDWGGALTPVPRADPPVQAQPVSVALLPEFKLDGGTEARRETVERTLFNPTRRPAPPAPAAGVAAAAMPRGTFTLTGTTVVDGTATAFLREVNGGKVRRVRKGETVNGMLVEDVKADRVRLAQGGDSEELVLRIAAGPRTTIQPAQPAPVAQTPAAVQQPGQPAPVQAAQQPPVAQDVAEVLAQRRRAARAAEAAARQQQQPAGTPPQQGQGGSQQGNNWSSAYQRLLQQRLGH